MKPEDSLVCGSQKSFNVRTFFFLPFSSFFYRKHPEAFSVLIAGSFHVAMQIQHRVDLATQSAKGA